MTHMGAGRHDVGMSHVNVVPLRVPMRPRDPHEPGRVATPLELFFDLVFVTAIASAGVELHHGIVEGHLESIAGYAMTFFAIWWAWVNYTWFASAYAVEDVVFRVLTFVIMGGSLILAAGVPGFFDDGQSGIVVAGYAVMRVAMALLWFRAARHDPGRRTIALTYAAGILIVQAFWIARLLVHDETLVYVTFGVGVLLELAVPFVAERRRHTPFHPEHGAERSGLLTIIVLGEVVLATVEAAQTALAGGGGARGLSVELVLLVTGAFLVVIALWWLYFRRDHADLVEHPTGVWVFGYLHYAVYAGVAAVGAGLAASVEVATHEAHVSAQSVEWLLAAAVSIYLLTVSGLHLLGGDRIATSLVPGVVVSALVLGTAAVGPPIGIGVLLIGLVLVADVVHHHLTDQRTEG